MTKPKPAVDNSRFWLDKRDAFPDTFLEVIKSAPAQLTSTERFLLFTLVRSLSPAVAIEIGTFRGGSASIIAAALRSAQFGHVWCIDPNPKLDIDWNQIADRATLIQEPSPKAFKTISSLTPSAIEFVFIDGDHSFDAVVRDTIELIPYLADNAWLLYHDAASHTVANAIDHCLSTTSQFRDAGMLSRYFNSDCWPGELFAGMRLVHFQRGDRFSWLPPSSRTPRPDLLPEQLSNAQTAGFREQLMTIASSGSSPIGLYGLTSRLAGLLGVLAEFPELKVVILEDDPILDGRVVLGWPVLFAPSAVARGIHDIIPMCSIADIPNDRLDFFRSHSMNVVNIESCQQPVNGRPVAQSPSTSPEQKVWAATTHAFWYEGCRRFAFWGTNPKVYPIVGRFLTSQPYPNLVAMIRSSITAPDRLWGIPVIDWDEVAAMKIDCIIVPDASDESVVKRELERNDLSRIHLAIPTAASWWSKLTGSS